MSKINKIAYNKVLSDIAAYKKQFNKDICFIAVTKNRSVDDIEELIAMGHTNFGENRVQEALEKYIPIKQKYPHIILHFIGQMQSNKVKQAFDLFDVFHTIDSQSVVDEFAKFDNKLQQKQFFVQISIAGEPQKGGIDLTSPDILSNFINYCTSKKLNITGLMAVPPLNESTNYEQNKASNLPTYFALAGNLQLKHNLQNLSIGMSADYSLAINLHATHIRIGSKLFIV